MAGLFAIVVACLAFIVPLAVALAMPGWRQLLVAVIVAAVFFAWLTWDLANPDGVANAIGSFLGGLMLFGFAGGAVARAVGLLGRRS